MSDMYCVIQFLVLYQDLSNIEKRLQQFDCYVYTSTDQGQTLKYKGECIKEIKNYVRPAIFRSHEVVIVYSKNKETRTMIAMILNMNDVIEVKLYERVWDLKI